MLKSKRLNKKTTEILKKSFSVLLCFCINFSLFTHSTVSAEIDIERDLSDALFNLTSLNIVDSSIEDILEQSMSRSEFAKIISKVLSCDDINISEKCEFEDVSEEHENINYISLMSNFGIMNGYSEKAFYPDAKITFAQCIKVLVDITGYKIDAQRNGGYPQGYLHTASKLKIAGKITNDYDSEMKVKDILICINEALQVDVLAENVYVSGEQHFEIAEGDTLLASRMEHLDLIKGEGIVKATESSSVDNRMLSDRDSVRIENENYKIGVTYADELLGHKVEFYAKSEGVYELVSVRKHRNSKEKIIDVNQTETYIKDGQIVIDYDSKEHETISTSGTHVVLINGKYENVKVNDITIPSIGYLKVIDNDNDGNADIVFVYDGVIAKVKQVNLMYDRIVFKDAAVNGKQYFQFDSSSGFSHDIFNRFGEPITLQDINSDDYVLIYASSDNKVCEIYLEDEIINGQVVEIEDETKILINEKQYETYDREYTDDISLGVEGIFNVVKGNIIADFKVGSNVENEAVAYIEAKDMSGALRGIVSLRLIDGGNFEVVEEDTDDDGMLDKRYMQIANTGVVILELSERVKINGDRVTKEEAYELLNVDAINPENSDVIKYQTNADGKIFKIDVLNRYGDFGNRTLNIQARLFGGNLGGAFLVDDETKIVAIPAEIDEFDEEVYLAVNDLENFNPYEVIGLEVGDETHTAEVALILTNSNTASGKITSKTKVSIVAENKSVRNEDDIFVSNISGFTAGSKFERNVVEELSEQTNNYFIGDLFYYALDYKGRISDVIPLLHTRSLNGYFSDTTEGIYYGVAKFVYGNYIGDESMDVQDVLHLDVSVDGETPRIEKLMFSASTKPPMYLYDKSKKEVKPASIYDVQTIDVVGREKASEVYVKYDESTVKVVLIINK